MLEITAGHWPFLPFGQPKSILVGQIYCTFPIGQQLITYGTAQMQVDGLAQVLALTLKYSRANTCVENASAQHEHNTTAHAMSLNRQAESFTS